MSQTILVMKSQYWAIALAVVAVLVAIMAFVIGMLVAADQFMQEGPR